MTLPLHGFQDWQNPLHTADLLTDTTSTNINGGGDFVTPIVYDMRNYQSCSIMVSASDTGAATSFGSVTFTVSWWANAAGSQIVYKEKYEFFPENNTAGFASAFGRVMIHDAVHGPYMTIVVHNGGADQILFAWRILGNTRTIGKRYLINCSVSDGATSEDASGVIPEIVANLAAGATVDQVIPISPGPAFMRVFTQGAAGTFTAFSPRGAKVLEFIQAAGVAIYPLVALPRSALRLHVVNTGAVLAQYVWTVSQSTEAW